MAETVLTQLVLDNLNVPQGRMENRAYLDSLGGVDALVKMIGTNLETGLNEQEVVSMRERFGDNRMPFSPTQSYIWLLYLALTDLTLVILSAAAAVSFAVGYYEDPEYGWIEAVAIFIAVFLVSNISAFNGYTKELQFRELERSSQQDEKVSVMRAGVIELLNPADLVVGDLMILQGGDAISADSVLINRAEVSSSESALTGEPEDLKKRKDKDCFLLSSCLITEGEGCRSLVIGIGMNSQWGKIKASLVTVPVNTPLQDKLAVMTKVIGYTGMTSAAATFAALLIRIWVNEEGDTDPSQAHIAEGVIEAFILAVTVVVVAIPEGLPLAVTISLAYSTKKMYNDQCFIRQASACETMGNATTICSDKTGTLTENRMTVVEGWFGGKEIYDDRFEEESKALNEGLKKLLAEQIAINRTAYLILSETGAEPIIVGNKTEGALINMIRGWGFDYEQVKNGCFDDVKDMIFPFSSDKKRSSAVIHRADGSVTVFCKGASEWLLNDCSSYKGPLGEILEMTPDIKKSLENKINSMASRALRTLMLCHVDFPSANDLPKDWRDNNPPDSANLVCDCIVGIIDPLRSDVKEAVATAQRAGVVVRMVTGDSFATASAIAMSCGILTGGGMALEGPDFRKMTPKDLDAILPRLQVLARSSPQDKFLLVTRLNGYAIPKNQEEWEEKHKNTKRADGVKAVTWEDDRDKILPGYYEEWIASRPDGGQVVAVTGDGTNDAPALKAADVGLAMGISGTKVAQGAADVVILDDKFSSIVKAIMWGRTVFDNIRKFLQYQLTVNLVALPLVFVGAVSGKSDAVLNAIMILWINLIASCMGALALATEPPTLAALARRPYKRNAFLITRPMRRNIICMTIFQFILMMVLLFQGAQLFGVPEGITCERYGVKANGAMWDINTKKTTNDRNLGVITCKTFRECDKKNFECFENKRYYYPNGPTDLSDPIEYKFADLYEFEEDCLDCQLRDYRHGTIIFNTFIFCQFFNEYTSKSLLDDWFVFGDLLSNPSFLMVSAFLVGAQVFLVEIGGDFLKTSPLTIAQWFITIALACIGMPLGMLMRWIPITEDPDSFFVADGSLFDISKVDNEDLSVLEVQEIDGVDGDCGGNKKMLFRIPSADAQTMNEMKKHSFTSNDGKKMAALEIDGENGDYGHGKTAQKGRASITGENLMKKHSFTNNDINVSKRNSFTFRDFIPTVQNDEHKDYEHTHPYPESRV